MDSTTIVTNAIARIRRIAFPARASGVRSLWVPRMAAALGLALSAAPAYAVAPNANAGPDQTVDEQTGVNLNGTGSTDDDIISAYAWTQISGPGVALTGANTATPSFTAPVRLVSQGNATLVFRLTVTDSEVPALQGSDDVTITVQPVNANPVANAGNDQNVADGAPVSLNGSGSSDADGPIASYSWNQIQGPGVTLNGAGTATPSFTAPNRTVAQGPVTLRFQLTVTDGDGVSDNDTVDVTVNPQNSDPVANAGNNQNVNEQVTVNLNGNGSSDADGPIVSFAWAQTGGSPNVILSGASTATPSFTAPARTVQQGSTTLTFTLTVTDNDGVTDQDSVDVTINPVNADPVANAGPDQTVDENSPVSLNGTASSDSDGTIDSYAWVQTSGPNAPLSGANSATPSFTSPDLPGDDGATLVFQLTVTDNEGATDTDTVSIDVDQVNVAPIITGQNPVSTPEETAITIALGNLVVTDPDDTYPDDFTLSVQNGTNYTRNGATITPVTNFVGNLTVPVTVNDGQATSNTFNLVVEVTQVNDDPEITGQQPLSTLEDTSITIVIGNLTVVDPDTPPANLTLSLQPGANYTLAGNVVTPAANFNGRLDVNATVSDGIGTSPVFPVRVDVTSVNDLPTLVAPIGAQNAVEASNFQLDISTNFDDADGENLAFAATGLPPSGNISFNTNTGVFSGTPRFEDTEPAVYNVSVSATDGAGEVATDTFTLTISALDRANVSLDVSVAPNPAMANDELQWTFTARNPVGPQAAAGLELVGSFFGSGLTVSSADPCNIAAPSGGSTDFTCTIGSLPVGGSATIVIRTLTSESGDVTAFGLVRGINPVPIDPNLDDNDDQTAVGVADVFSNGALQILGNSSVRSIAAGDLNGDGSNDLVVGTSAGQPVRVHLSDGFRTFSEVPISLPDSMANEGVALADFDNNGTLDIVVANGGGQADMVYANDGAGNFSVMATLGMSFAQDVAVGDFDDDNNMDIAIATIQENPIYLGNGNGTFDLHASLGAANSTAVAVGQINADGRDDVVFANIGAPSRAWTKNSGNGFSSADQIDIGDATSVALADTTGNGRINLAVFGRISADIGDIPANPVLSNNGSGNFGNPDALLGNAPTFDVMFGDVNSDGDLDIVFVNESGVHQIWNRDGGGYSLHSEQIVADGAVAGVVTDLGFTDVSEPGGVDLAMGGAVQPGAGVYLNDGFGNLGRGDAVPPVLTLVGDDPLEVPSNTTFADPGATATDNIDGDITRTIVVDNPVNTAVVGTYTVTYTVSDFAGNPADPITRTVNVIPSAGSGGGGGGGTIGYALLIALGMLILVSQYRQRRVPVRIRNRGTRQ